MNEKPSDKPVLTAVTAERTETQIVFTFTKNVARATDYGCSYKTGSEAA